MAPETEETEEPWKHFPLGTYRKQEVWHWSEGKFNISVGKDLLALQEKNMQKYGISVREILKRTVIVEAENVAEAVQKVETAVERDEILLDVDDYDDREIVPSEYWEGGRIPDGEDVSCYWHLDYNDR